MASEIKNVADQIVAGVAAITVAADRVIQAYTDGNPQDLADAIAELTAARDNLATETGKLDTTVPPPPPPPDSAKG